MAPVDLTPRRIGSPVGPRSREDHSTRLIYNGNFAVGNSIVRTFPESGPGSRAGIEFWITDARDHPRPLEQGFKLLAKGRRIGIPSLCLRCNAATIQREPQ